MAASPMIYAVEVVLLSVMSLWCVWLMLRSADRKFFPETYLPQRAPEVLVTFDDYSPLDWKGLI